MGKIKSKSWSPRPSTTQSGVLNYSTLTAKKQRVSGKTRKRRAMARNIARTNDAIRQFVDTTHGVDFEYVRELLDDNPNLTLDDAKLLARRDDD